MKTSENKYYIYFYLREDYTPYYVGKGCRNRYNSSRRVIPKPTDKSKIIIVHDDISEIYSFILERYYIRWFGRKDINTGILRNLTDGGDGVSGYKFNKENIERRAKILSVKHSGSGNPMYGVEPWNKGKKGLQKQSDLQKQNHSIRMKGSGNPMFGRKHSPETLEKIRQKALLRNKK